MILVSGSGQSKDSGENATCLMANKKLKGLNRQHLRGKIH